MGKISVAPVSKPVTKSVANSATPPRCRVLMHNDDYTTMEFVIHVLEEVFHKPSTEANQVMLNIHFKGVGVCGVYPFDIAETRVARVHVMAREAGFPLRCTLEDE